jgi:hypothetical protein
MAKKKRKDGKPKSIFRERRKADTCMHIFRSRSRDIVYEIRERPDKTLIDVRPTRVGPWDHDGDRIAWRKWHEKLLAIYPEETRIAVIHHPDTGEVMLLEGEPDGTCTETYIKAFGREISNIIDVFDKQPPWTPARPDLMPAAPCPKCGSVEFCEWSGQRGDEPAIAITCNECGEVIASSHPLDPDDRPHRADR